MRRFWGQHAPTMSPKTGPSGRIDTLTGIIHIGKSICVTGEITSNEDLTIEGKVVGRIELKNHNLVIGSNAQVRAEITAKSVQILGSVLGNVSATGQVKIGVRGRAKLLIGVARGRRKADKRRQIEARQAKRDIERVVAARKR